MIIPAALPPRLKVAHTDHTNQDWNACVFMWKCVSLWGLITPRWILISVWWDTKHQSQSADALAANHFNGYILFWPFSELFFVFHITSPLLHYSLSVLGLFYIHTVPFNSLSHPAPLLSHPPPTCLFHLLILFLSFLTNLHPFVLLHSSPFWFPALYHIHS